MEYIIAFLGALVVLMFISTCVINDKLDKIHEELKKLKHENK
jgi:hypothetical protein